MKKQKGVLFYETSCKSGLCLTECYLGLRECPWKMAPHSV